MIKNVGVLFVVLAAIGLVACGDDEALIPSGSSSAASSQATLTSSASAISSSSVAMSSSEALSSTSATSSSAISSSAASSTISSSVASSSSGPVAVSFSGLTANGTSGAVTTTQLTLNFDVEPVGLALGDITVTGATKGTLSGSGTTRTLAISDITIVDGQTVAVGLTSPTGYSISPASKTVAVYRNYREMVSVPGGTFTQKPTSGNTFSHAITGFKMAKYEVTYDLWHAVYQWAIANGYYFANAGREGQDGTDGAAPTSAKYEPVTMINWRDAIVWCNAYSQMEGKIPVYYSDAGFTTAINDSRDDSYGSTTNVAEGGFDNPYVNWAATGYRLPTEGEWQYAASYRNGTDWTPYNYASGATAAYTDATATDMVAWYSANSAHMTKTVGTKGSNALGFHDMSGNVWEWCWDWYTATLPATAQTNYRGPASTIDRILRGGVYGSVADYLQVGYRGSGKPYSESITRGLRLVQTQ